MNVKVASTVATDILQYASTLLAVTNVIVYLGLKTLWIVTKTECAKVSHSCNWAMNLWKQFSDRFVAGKLSLDYSCKMLNVV